MGGSCPHCGAVEFELEAGGTVRRCRACGRSSLRGGEASPPNGSLAAAVPASSIPPAAAVAVDPLPASRRRPAGPGEVPILPAAGLALLATLLFYGALRFIPETRLAELFVERGWVQYAITFVSSWALALLAAKRRRLVRERRLLGRDWLARPGAGPVLQPADVDAALAHLAGQADFDFDALLARRLVRALRHFQARRRVVEVVEFLNAEARADEGRIDASYGLVRVFIWAVPTLGFIGTVIGIGSAVAGFSTTLETASSIEGMRESIESVTSGLGVAFDTTLLALVMSIVVMFPSNALQRLEETFLGEVDDYCAEHLVRRLADETSAEPGDAALDRLVERLIAALHKRGASGA
ncbi:MAG: MotA/TolQ/ExbB proton channel family protein [Myxococcota bacterium]